MADTIPEIAGEGCRGKRWVNVQDWIVRYGQIRQVAVSDTSTIYDIARCVIADGAYALKYEFYEIISSPG